MEGKRRRKEPYDANKSCRKDNDDGDAEEMAASIKLEVFGLAWLVREVCLDRGYTSAWDLVKEVHSFQSEHGQCGFAQRFAELDLW